jgi:integrase
MPRRTFGTVRQLPSGRWQARYRHGSGQQKAAPTTFATKADANRWLSRAQADMDRGDWFDPHAGKETLSSYAARWVETRLVRGRPLAPRTAELYRWQLQKHVIPAFATTELRRLDATAVRTWYGRLSGPAGPGQVTAAKCYRLLRAICHTAVEDSLIAKNPCAIRGAGQERSAERPMLSVAQVDALADTVDRRWRALILLAAWCGLRFGELAALTRRDLDLDGYVVNVRAAASTLTTGQRYIGPPKSQAGIRSVAIPPHIVVDLREHLASFAEPERTGLVFVGPQGATLNNSNFNRVVWRPACEAVGIAAGTHLHDLRGVSATLAARHGATTRELMRRLGHATPNMALRYQRAEAERDAAIARAMSDGRALGEARPAPDRRSVMRHGEASLRHGLA